MTALGFYLGVDVFIESLSPWEHEGCTWSGELTGSLGKFDRTILMRLSGWLIIKFIAILVDIKTLLEVLNAILHAWN